MQGERGVFSDTVYPAAVKMEDWAKGLYPAGCKPAGYFGWRHIEKLGEICMNIEI
jgi:hypothetical protein